MKAEIDGRDVFAIYVRRWKRPFLEAYFPHANFQYLPLYVNERQFLADWQARIRVSNVPTLLVWGRNLPEWLEAFAQRNLVPIVFLEDGFLRSLLPNASHTAPFSLTLDTQRPYFDAGGPSDLEDILNAYRFSQDIPLLERAKLGISSLLESKLSKYNALQGAGPGFDPPPHSTKRILVLGQVEEDASIRYGCDRPISNNDVVRLAAAENPNCEIIYKPHPDVLNGVRRGVTNPSDVAHLAKVLTEAAPLPELLASVDHVYTITSLGGFEALLRGIPVTVLGCPFYACWGLTDDRQPNPRRKRKLTIEELFAGAYLLYARYYNPVTAEEITFEQCLLLASTWRESGMPESRIAPPDPLPLKAGFQLIGPYGILSWRYVLTQPLAWLIAWLGNHENAREFKRNPILFFRELSDPRFRKLGRIIYPWDS